jgi:hypothetical protein
MTNRDEGNKDAAPDENGQCTPGGEEDSAVPPTRPSFHEAAERAAAAYRKKRGHTAKDEKDQDEV